VEPRLPLTPMDLCTWQITRASELARTSPLCPRLGFQPPLSLQAGQHWGAHRVRRFLCKVTKKNIEVLRADLEQKVWVVKGAQWEPGVRAFNGMTRALPAVIEPTSNALSSQGISPSRTKATWDLWHRRLTHLGFDSMKLLFGGLSTGSSIARTGHLALNKGCACEGCVMGKIVRPPFLPSSSHAKAVISSTQTSVARWVSTRSGELDM